ncbi:MAG: KAP family NTPase [Clostridiales bacterium]|nr:KAP family NTPase [Clostridiales bacterium]
MNTIKELKNYCEICNPAGALMLSREWGCRKTYLIKNKLIPAVKNTCIVLCISLFGLDTLEAIKQEVRKQWIDKLGEIGQSDGKVFSKFAKTYKNFFWAIKEVLPEDWQAKGETVSSFMDFVNFMPISNAMRGKEVILVFDDLERSNISSLDILGCINDYCENQRFHVIIVANEEKIRKTSNSDNDSGETPKSSTILSYNIIKEKIVQRTIHFNPNNEEIVANCCKEFADGTEYYCLLNNNKEALTKILSSDFDDDATIAKFKLDNYKLGDKTNVYEMQEKELRELLEQRPHNIRSFKYAIQDFERVYNVLKKVGFNNYDNWLLTFTCYMMTYKAGKISDEPRYGKLFPNCKVEKLYPGIFNSYYIVDGIIQWIEQGEWNQTMIEEELKKALDREKAITPIDILKTHFLPEIEDEVIRVFPELIKMAYDGKLTLDEYVILIENSMYARKYQADIPNIDWEKVKKGIELRFEKMIISNNNDNRCSRMIAPNSKKCFTEKEWSTYQFIEDFWNQDRLIYEKNSRLYIDLMNNHLDQAFEKLNNKSYNGFTLEMEKATFNAYKDAENNKKNFLILLFSRIWSGFGKKQDMNIQLTESSLNKLKNELETLKSDYEKQEKSIAVGNTKYFIKEIDKILDMENCDKTV